MKRKDWTGGLFFIYLAFVIWVILLKFSTSPDALPHLRNINLIPYGDCLMINGNLNIRELAENILIFVPFGIYGGMLARERAGGTVILAGAGFSLFLETLQYLLATVSYTHLDVYKRQCFASEAPEIGVCVPDKSCNSSCRRSLPVMRFLLLWYDMRIISVQSTEQFGIKEVRIPFDPDILIYKRVYARKRIISSYIL